MGQVETVKKYTFSCKHCGKQRKIWKKNERGLSIKNKGFFEHPKQASMVVQEIRMQRQGEMQDNLEGFSNARQV